MTTNKLRHPFWMFLLELNVLIVSVGLAYVSFRLYDAERMLGYVASRNIELSKDLRATKRQLHLIDCFDTKTTSSGEAVVVVSDKCDGNFHTPDLSNTMD